MVVLLLTEGLPDKGHSVPITSHDSGCGKTIEAAPS